MSPVRKQGSAGESKGRRGQLLQLERSDFGVKSSQACLKRVNDVPKDFVRFANGDFSDALTAWDRFSRLPEISFNEIDGVVLTRGLDG
jgi:hypothetical protein